MKRFPSNRRGGKVALRALGSLVLALVLSVSIIGSNGALALAGPGEESTTHSDENTQTVGSSAETTEASATPETDFSTLAVTYGWDGSTLTINGHVAGSLGDEMIGAASAGLMGYTPEAVIGFVVNGEAITSADWRAFRGGVLLPTPTPPFPMYPNVLTVDISGTSTTNLTYYDTFSNVALQYIPTTKITLPQSIETIGHSAFANMTALTTVENMENATRVESFAFFQTAIPEAVFPYVTYVGPASFAFCAQMTKADFPQLLVAENTDVAIAGSFRGCTELSEVHMPVVESLGIRTFRGDTALETIELPSATTFGGEVFRDCANLAVAYLPKAQSFSVVPLPAPPIPQYGAFDNCSALSLLIFGDIPTFERGNQSTYFAGISPTAIMMYASGDPSFFSTAEGWDGGTAHYVTPQNQTVVEGESAKIVFITEGSVDGDPAATSYENIPPYLNVMWLKDLTSLPDDTNGTLAFPQTVVSDSGVYTPVVFNTSDTPGSWSRWPSSTLTVTAKGDDGTTTATPTGTPSSKGTPKTGDMPVGLLSLSLIAVMGAGAVALARRQRKQAVNQ